MKVIYSFNKTGEELVYWTREIAASSNDIATFVPFNHGKFLCPSKYSRAQILDNTYYEQNPNLLAMYNALRTLIEETKAAALLVDNMAPYHPEFLRTLDIYKILRTSDGPLISYDRDFAYVHAYDHIMYHSRAYSRDMTMAEKLWYVGAKRADFWPHAVFDQMFDSTKTEAELFGVHRDIDVIFVGALFVGKMPVLGRLKKEFGRRFRMYGLSSWKRNVYFNLKFGFPGWVRPIEIADYVPLYQRAKIGVNIHNRGKYTVGSYRLFDLPANGVMQVSDGGEFLNDWYNVGTEIVANDSTDELIEKIKYYLTHSSDREAIARNGYRRVMRDHRIGLRMRELATLIHRGMSETF